MEDNRNWFDRWMGKRAYKQELKRSKELYLQALNLQKRLDADCRITEGTMLNPLIEKLVQDYNDKVEMYNELYRGLPKLDWSKTQAR